MSLKSGIFFLAGLISISTNYGQNATNQAFVKLLRTELADNTLIYCYNPFGANAIFWPEDIKQPQNGPDRLDQIIRKGNEIFILIDGTNHLYRLIENADQTTMQRVDRAVFAGHNFNSFKFLLHDSLYSIGGFGFNHYNGLLLKYEPNTSDWQHQTLNKEILIEFNSIPGIWLDQDEGVVYKIGVRNLYSPDSTEAEQENLSSALHLLNLKKRKWLQKGVVNSQSGDFINQSVRISWHPSGELILAKNASGKRIYLVDYKNNQIRPLKMWASEKISASFSDSVEDFRGRFLVWHNQDSINILRSDGILRKHQLSSHEFAAPLAPIWNEKRMSISEDLNIYLAGFFLFGCGMLVAAILFIRKRKSSIIPEAKLQSESIFTRSELEILQVLQSSVRKELLPDEVNELLGTSKKTIEVQKKQRSDAIKGINEKYRRLSNTSDNLIIQERLSDDRRQVRYLLNPAALEKLKNIVSGI